MEFVLLHSKISPMKTATFCTRCIKICSVLLLLGLENVYLIFWSGGHKRDNSLWFCGWMLHFASLWMFWHPNPAGVGAECISQRGQASKLAKRIVHPLLISSTHPFRLYERRHEKEGRREVMAENKEKSDTQGDGRTWNRLGELVNWRKSWLKRLR